MLDAGGATATTGSDGTNDPANDGLEARIADRAPSFELPALLDLLDHLYGGRDHWTLELQGDGGRSSRPELIRAIRFERIAPGRTVVWVTLNLGLMSARSPLPGYMQKFLERRDDNGLASSFIRFFDRWLLNERVRALHPERDPELFPQLDAVRLDVLRLIGPAAPTSMAWLLKRVFPELELRVVRQARIRKVRAPSFRMGVSPLGTLAAVGGWYSRLEPGLTAWLYAGEPRTDTGVPWVDEARRRLETQLRPVLAGLEVAMVVLLVFQGDAEPMRLGMDGRLGYGWLKGSQDAGQQVVVWEVP